MSVIISRALPDVRDGLKPSQRRILVAMNDLNLGPESGTHQVRQDLRRHERQLSPARRSRRSIRRWSAWPRIGTCGIVLIDKQGNFGSIAGLPPAAMRYTEARLSPSRPRCSTTSSSTRSTSCRTTTAGIASRWCCRASFPNLLVNGSDGIAVGMATEIPPHNLSEVCDGLIALIDEPEVTIDRADGDHPRPRLSDRRHHLRPPGHPRRLPHRPRQGHPPRARRDQRRGQPQSDHHHAKCPIQQTRNRLAEAIGELVKDERIKGISAIRDESAPERRAGPPGHRPQARRRSGTWCSTSSTSSRRCRRRSASSCWPWSTAGRGRCRSSRCCEEFLRHRVQVIRRRTEYLLREAKRRGHILEGQLIAISSLDEVIAICRSRRAGPRPRSACRTCEVAAACWSGPWATSTSPPCSTRSACSRQLSHDRGAGRGGGAPAARPAGRPGARRDRQGIQRAARADPQLRRAAGQRARTSSPSSAATWSSCATSTATSGGRRSSTRGGRSRLSKT